MTKEHFYPVDGEQIFAWDTSDYDFLKVFDYDRKKRSWLCWACNYHFGSKPRLIVLKYVYVSQKRIDKLVDKEREYHDNDQWCASVRQAYWV